MGKIQSTFDFTFIDAIFQDIYEIGNSISELNETKKDLKQRLPEALSKAAESATNDDKLFAAWVLYWHTNEIYPKEISQRILNTSVANMRDKFVKNGLPCAFKCCKCDQPIEAEHRQQLSFHRRLAHVHGFTTMESKFEQSVMCLECADDYIKTTLLTKARENYDIDSPDKESTEQLKRMPYSKYLKSEHWQERRLRHLRSAGFRCQLCNDKDTSLHVHHRTYARKGCERYSDLIVLCEECHRLFHDRQNLKREEN